MQLHKQQSQHWYHPKEQLMLNRSTFLIFWENPYTHQHTTGMQWNLHIALNAFVFLCLTHSIQILMSLATSKTEVRVMISPNPLWWIKVFTGNKYPIPGSLWLNQVSSDDFWNQAENIWIKKTGWEWKN